MLTIPYTDALFEVREELYKPPVALLLEDEHFVLPFDNRRYIRTNLSAEALVHMLQHAVVRD